MNKKKKENVTKGEKKDEAKAPKELKRLLEVINFTPANADLPSPDELIKKFFKEQTGRDLSYEDTENLETDSDFMESLKKTIKNIRSGIKKYQDLSEYIFEQHIPELFEPFDIWDRYKDFIEYRQKIRFAAREAVDYRKRGRRRITFSSIYNPETFKTSFSITKEGLISLKDDILFKALEGIAARRLRICEVCERIFWANRLDKEGCSGRCNQTLRSRRKREKDENRFNSRVKKDAT